MSVRIECLLECANHLGESPIWDVEDGLLYWVDGTGPRVDKPAVWRMDPKTGKVENWRVDKDVGAMVLRQGGNAVMALADGFYFIDFDSGKTELVAKVDDVASNYVLGAVPLFIFMGSLLERSGVAERPNSRCGCRRPRYSKKSAIGSITSLRPCSLMRRKRPALATSLPLVTTSPETKTRRKSLVPEKRASISA